MHTILEFIQILIYSLHLTFLASETPYAKRYEIASAIQHPAYSLEKDSNDIGIVRLRKSILFNAGVGPVCLPFK